jgi:cytochrome c553
LRLISIALASLLATQTFAMAAGDAAAGKKKSIKCQVCHGVDGVSKNPEAPNISGQSERYIIKSIKAFQSGERKNEQMSLVVKTLSDEDIANLAAWYSSIKVTVEMPK